MELTPCKTVHGFTVRTTSDLPEIDGRAYVLDHNASRAQLLYLQNDDANKAFSIAFKTPPANDTGVFHILEHSVLCGSDKFPVKEPFVNLLKSSMQTFLNAMTYPDKTIYPVASTNEQDLLNLMDVYLDAVLHPAIFHKRAIFEQEGWHVELAGEEGSGKLAYNGVVYNEMKGALSDPESILYDELSAALFPDTAYRFESAASPPPSRRFPTRSFSTPTAATTTWPTRRSCSTGTWISRGSSLSSTSAISRPMPPRQTPMVRRTRLSCRRPSCRSGTRRP